MDQVEFRAITFSHLIKFFFFSYEIEHKRQILSILVLWRNQKKHKKKNFFPLKFDMFWIHNFPLFYSYYFCFQFHFTSSQLKLLLFLCFIHFATLNEAKAICMLINKSLTNSMFCSKNMQQLSLIIPHAQAH